MKDIYSLYKQAGFMDDFDARMKEIEERQRKVQKRIDDAVERNKSAFAPNHSWSGLGGRSNKDLLWDLGGAVAGGGAAYVLAKLLGFSGKAKTAVTAGGALSGALGMDSYRSGAGQMHGNYYGKAITNRLLSKSPGELLDEINDNSNI